MCGLSCTIYQSTVLASKVKGDEVGIPISDAKMEMNSLLLGLDLPKIVAPFDLAAISIQYQILSNGRARFCHVQVLWWLLLLRYKSLLSSPNSRPGPLIQGERLGALCSNIGPGT